MSTDPSLPDDPHLAEDISLPGPEDTPADDQANGPEPTALTNAGQDVPGIASGGVAQEPGTGEREPAVPDPEGPEPEATPGERS